MAPSQEVVMLPEWTSPLVAKAKVAGLLGAALAAGGLGGTLALTHITPVAHQTVQTSAASTSADPESTDAADPESTDAPDPETSPSDDPESTGSQDPETGQAQTPADCPAGVKNHGAYVSSVAHSAAKGTNGDHGATVSAAAKSDCGKKAQGSTGSDGSGDPESGDAGSGDTGSKHSGAVHGSSGSSKTKSGEETKPPVSAHVSAAPKPGKGAGKGNSKH